MYLVINRNYLGLSRQMEFDADAIAASVSGGNNLVSALSKIELASSCYATALGKADELLKQNLVSKNIFTNQLTVYRSIAEKYKLPMKAQLPEVSYQFIASFSKSRVNYEDQWASHPTLEERKEHLETLALNSEPEQEPAWHIFQDPRNLQEQLTTHLYERAKVDGHSEEYDGAYFDDWYKKEKDKLTLPAQYQGFYDNRLADTGTWDINALSQVQPSLSFEELFSPENAELQLSINMNEKDLATVTAIKEREIDVRSFDFDGAKYALADAAGVIAILEKEIMEQKQRQQMLDKAAYNFFYEAAGEQAGEIKQLYVEYQQSQMRNEDYVEIANNTMVTIRPFFNGNLNLEAAIAIIASLKETHEPILKRQFGNFISRKYITASSAGDLYKRVANFIDRSYCYLINNELQTHELNELCDLMESVAEELHEVKFACYKNMLKRQLELSRPQISMLQAS